jgi:hypothetical protein
VKLHGLVVPQLEKRYHLFLVGEIEYGELVESDVNKLHILNITNKEKNYK